MPDAPPNFSILCFSHLIWEETLFQRPQQIMRQFQRMGHAVAYLSMTGTRRWLRLRWGQPRMPLAGVSPDGVRFRTMAHLPLAHRLTFLKPIDPLRLRAAARAARRQLPPGPVVLWLYHPDLAPSLAPVPRDLLVYDVMDPFDAFERSGALTPHHERQLLRDADVVFTGGRAIHERKAPLRPDAECFPSGVEADHFGRALHDATPAAPELATLPHPVLGYIGAIDERIDFRLVEDVCRARPGWSFVFIGPLIEMKRPPVDAPNFHYLGPRPYARLPEYLKGFDVATMPFVQSPLTAHISPTKTPEYLAAGRPVVSTPIRDVERDYGDVVLFARGAAAFATACERALAQPRDWAAALAHRAAAASWETIARRMRDTVAARLAAKGGTSRGR